MGSEERARASAPSPARIRAGGIAAVTSLWRSTRAVAVVDAIQRLSGRPLFQGAGKLQLSTLWPSHVSGPAARVQPDGAAWWPIACSSRGTGLRCARLRAALQEKQANEQRAYMIVCRPEIGAVTRLLRPVDRPGSRSVGRPPACSRPPNARRSGARDKGRLWRHVDCCERDIHISFGPPCILGAPVSPSPVAPLRRERARAFAGWPQKRNAKSIF